IRKLRKDAGMTLNSLAPEAEVSSSLISQIERGKICPTIATLWKILTPLNQSIGSFFEDKEINNKKIVRKHERKQLNLSDSNAVYELLTPDLNGELEFLKITIGPGESNTDQSMIKHQGEECGVILEGSLEIILQNERYYLEEGDSIRFDSSIPHRFINTGEVKSISYWVMTPPSF
ncbi:MAG: cupin domain-containing protein, partial [Halarsenatibacteraceae bacterium]